MPPNNKYTNPTGEPGGNEFAPLTGRDLAMREAWDKRNPPPSGWVNPYDEPGSGSVTGGGSVSRPHIDSTWPADLGANYGDKANERKGAAYGISATRSHDYSGTEQSPHHTRPISSYQRTTRALGLHHEELAAEVMHGEHRDDD